jgi:ADP-ribosyl-[dinitrogen reductase] hydrolase
VVLDPVALELARDRARGCLLAGAIGDALGAPVEFDSWSAIRHRHGPSGVTGYLPAYGRSGGAITDDTQMTLFTAEGLVRALVRLQHRGIVDAKSVVRRAYWRWLTTQGESWPRPQIGSHGTGWLVSVDGLHARRAPGNTCLAALRSGVDATVDQPPNTSKGCGAVMRAAPVGLIGAPDAFVLGVEVGAITHGHPSGYLASGFLAATVAALFGGHRLEVALDTATARLRDWDGYGEVLAAVERARALADQGDPVPDKVESLGAGWVAEEALAIGVYCALAGGPPRDALLCAVNHSGDSDSTGSITGNLLGAALGMAAVPADLLAGLELADVITQVADDLVDAFHGEGVGDEYEPIDDRVRRWLTRYPGS